jgi:NDP-sugar pyrophosphorylase family protein
MSSCSIIQGGIIAAGHGSRLRADGYRVSKPMVPVAGRPLIDLTLDRFRAVGIRQLTIIINDTSDDCRQWLRDHAVDFDLDIIVRTTPSSYASFQTVVGRLVGAPAVITTIDAVMPVNDFCAFVKSATDFAKNAIALGLTEHVGDENPLWATLDVVDGRIRQLGGSHGTHVTAGLYWLPAQRPAAPTTSFARLRDYLGWLVAQHEPVCGIVLPCVFDIDRARDIAAAEAAGFGSERGNWAAHERG